MPPSRDLPHDSPLRSCDLTSAIRLKDVTWDTDGRTVVWLEGRGADGVVVCQGEEDEAPRELTAGFSVRARVGYGGGDFTVSRGRLYFVDRGERLFARDLAAGRPRPLAPAFGRPAAPTVSADGRWLVFVHSYEDVDRLAVIDTKDDHWPQSLVTGSDFYMQPTWHPRDQRIAWIEWDHPSMPWDGTRLVLGDLSISGESLPRLADVSVLAGAGNDEAVFQPEFSPDGRYLAYVSDRRGWSDVWLYDLETEVHRCLDEADGDVALPAWIQGLRVIGFSADSRHLLFTRTSDGRRLAYSCPLEGGEAAPVEALSAYTQVEQIAPSPNGDSFACIASSSEISPRVLSLRRDRIRIHARSTGESLRPGELSVPKPVVWSADNGDAVYGLYYPPLPTRDSEAPGKPPLIVHIHGGPTSQADAGFDAELQYFVTRGYAVVAVNHRGSTGYGRRYAQALRGNWGLFDVEDAVGAAQHLVDENLADLDRLVISGGSAGGYTVLRALTVKPGFFRAGVCRYGISNLFSLAADTHKFEARYTDSLLGPLPEASQVYRDRSPLFAADSIRDPVIIFQGTEDEVVDKSQADAIVESLKRRSVPHEYHVYEGEGHGWRKPQTIEHYITAVESFLKEHVLYA